MSTKRAADNYLTQDSRDDDTGDGSASSGASDNASASASTTFSRASDDVLKSRRILGPKRRSAAPSAASPSVAVCIHAFT